MSISVVIPAYNRAHLIGETLRSLLMQTELAAEIIVVDDGSTDGTAEVAAKLGAPVKVIRRANGGPAAARNTGFQASTGKFIHFFDSDDLAAPNKQEVQLKALEAGGADIAYGPWIKGRFDGKFFSPTNQVFQQHGLPEETDLVRALLTNWSVVPHAALFRRSIVDRAGGFPEDLFGTEDQQMFLSCLLAGAKVVHTPGTIEFYREGDAGKITESKTGKERHIREWGRFLLKARETCVHKDIDPVHWFGFRQRAWKPMKIWPDSATGTNS
ncbi:MAG: glycosyltransferase family 2 protein [Limisphaerales bacterium]